MSLLSILKNSVQSPDGNGYDPIRILFAIGGTNGVLMPVVFQVWAFIKGQAWDPIGFCTGYGGLLAAVITAGGIAMRNKDKGLAEANAITATSLKDTANGASTN